MRRFLCYFLIAFLAASGGIFKSSAYAEERVVDVELLDYSKFKIEPRIKVPAIKELAPGNASWIANKTRPDRNRDVHVRRIAVKVGDWVNFGEPRRKELHASLTAQAQNGLMRIGGPGFSINRLQAVARGTELVYVYCQGGLLSEDDYFPRWLVIVEIK